MFNQVCMFITLLKISPPVCLFGTDFYQGPQSTQANSSPIKKLFLDAIRILTKLLYSVGCITLSSKSEVTLCQSYVHTSVPKKLITCNIKYVTIFPKGAFTNYVYKIRGVGGQKDQLFVNFYTIENVNGGGQVVKKSQIL